MYIPSFLQERAERISGLKGKYRDVLNPTNEKTSLESVLQALEEIVADDSSEPLIKEKLVAICSVLHELIEAKN
jgi:methionine salvage enolase-phosphatase E1